MRNGIKRVAGGALATLALGAGTVMGASPAMAETYGPQHQSYVHSFDRGICYAKTASKLASLKWRGHAAEVVKLCHPRVKGYRFEYTSTIWWYYQK
ncbi:hypothetical protein ACTXOR_06315 [Arthrobacter rhombi]|uniref:hypothetical protein n=1 Tax=Arthrobacter rhombi TaxID=71253 RepID=UPI003FD368E9